MEQPTLFPELDPKKDDQPVIVDTAAIAAAGEARNRDYDPNVRQSEAQADLGGGIQAAHDGELDFAHAVGLARGKVATVRPTSSRNALSARGKEAADREPPKYPDARSQLLTSEEKAAGKAGLARIRGSLPSKGV